MLVLAAWLACSDAHALQRVQSGPTLELGVGPALGGAPAGFELAGQASVGWWFGPYDDDYALGRFWAAAITTRAGYTTSGGALTLTPLLELRRGMDLFVVAPHFLIAGGPVIGLGGPASGTPIGIAGRVGGGLKLRRTPRTGFIARLAGGLDYTPGVGTLAASVTLTLGVGWSSPVGSKRDAD